ncbi:uncharacterized protein LOC142528322 [Primulina tabacum]|uniref:uncharacterized protein LOC142528322 n=1 Tax=Primulina tabacum TaxID=48773 RepID=UPI003F595E52
MAIAITKCLIDRGLDKVFIVTVDNASSNDTTVKELSKQFSKWGTNFMDVACILKMLVDSDDTDLSCMAEKMKAKFEKYSFQIEYVAFVLLSMYGEEKGGKMRYDLKLYAANPPVRANVLHLSPEYSIPISESGKSILLPYFGKAICFQNSSMYHFSMFHASNHIFTVPAKETEIEVEASAIKIVAETIYPLNIVLDRVILNSTGVLLGCWQVVSGTDPVTIRTKLKTAIPRTPEKQLVRTKVSVLQIFHELVNRVNNQIRGMKATVSELWYVEEYDMLALAFNGKTKIADFIFDVQTLNSFYSSSQASRQFYQVQNNF